MMGCATLLFAFLHVVPVIGSRGQTDTKSAWLELSQWLDNKGGWVQSSIKSDFTNHGGAMIRGLVLTTSSFMGTTLIEVPRHLWLELSFWPEIEKASLAHHSTCNDLSDSEMHRLKFASGLALESRKGNASEHSTYLRHLPQLNEYKSFHPSFMNAQLQEDFRSLPVVEFAKRTQEDEARMKACFMSWKNDPQSSVKHVNFEEVESGLSHLRNRGFIVENHPLMVPVLDLINTEQSELVNADVHFNMDVVSLVVSSTWLGNTDELLYGYCQTCDNDVMLSQWGVFLESNANSLPTDHKVDCQGTRAATNTSSGHTGNLQKAASSALDLQQYQEGMVPRCKADTFKSEQGPLRCSLARLAWEYCGQSWMQKPGALQVGNGTSSSATPDPDAKVFLKAKKNKSSKATDWENMVDAKLIPLESKSSPIHGNVSHNRSALRQRNGRLQHALSR